MVSEVFELIAIHNASNIGILSNNWKLVRATRSAFKSEKTLNKLECSMATMWNRHVQV